MRAVKRERAFDSATRQWLKDNLARGCNRRELLDILLAQGHSLETIRTQMGPAFPLDTERSTAPLEPPPLIRRAPPNLKRFDSDQIELYSLEGFMSEKDCDRLVALCNHHLIPSKVAESSHVVNKDFRSSKTCELSLLRSPVATSINDKICRTLGISMEYSEGVQAQRYDVGEQFRAHHDFFAPGSASYAHNGGDAGNRTWTFMVYLNEGMEGGGTKFHELNHVFQPKKGMAVLWNNLHADRTPNKATLHSGEPVIAGHKIIITKWFREHGPGPMFLKS
jgi:prolyl 4-hydroxylase